eukprot:343127-Hanusia_phi.AAC.1
MPLSAALINAAPGGAGSASSWSVTVGLGRLRPESDQYRMPARRSLAERSDRARSDRGLMMAAGSTDTRSSDPPGGEGGHSMSRASPGEMAARGGD